MNRILNALALGLAVILCVLIAITIQNNRKAQEVEYNEFMREREEAQDSIEINL